MRLTLEERVFGFLAGAVLGWAIVGLFWFGH